jgi:hypothetical protein
MPGGNLRKIAHNTMVLWTKLMQKQTRPAARILDRKIYNFIRKILNIEGKAPAWSDADSPFFERIFLRLWFHII